MLQPPSINQSFRLNLKQFRNSYYEQDKSNSSKMISHALGHGFKSAASQVKVCGSRPLLQVIRELEILYNNLGG